MAKGNRRRFVGISGQCPPLVHKSGPNIFIVIHTYVEGSGQ